MKYELKAMGVGEILDQSIRILKDHFGLFLKIMLCLQIPFSLISVLLAFATLPVLSAHPTAAEIQAFTDASTRNLFLIQLPFSLLLMLTVVPITNAAIMHATAKLYLGQSTSITESFRNGLSRFGPLVWTWFLMYLFVYGGLLLCILPGILMLFRYALAGNVAVLEGISGMAALRRSRDLMLSDRTKHYNQFFLLGLLLLVIIGGVAASSQFIPNLYGATVVQVLLQAVGSAFGLIAVVVFYFSCRCRAENFDLMQLASAIQEARPEIQTTIGGAIPIDESGNPE